MEKAAKLGEYMAFLTVNGRPIIGCGWTTSEAQRNVRQQVQLGSVALLFVDIPVERERFQRVSK